MPPEWYTCSTKGCTGICASLGMTVGDEVEVQLERANGEPA